MSGQTPIVIGLGTGRCGTVSLAKLLSLQIDTNATHENILLPWKQDIKKFDVAWRALRNRGFFYQYTCDVAFYWLPYVEMMLKKRPDAKFVCLKRCKSLVVESYDQKTLGRNHWSLVPNPDSEREDPVWGPCFPKYDLNKREGIARYWDDYYAQADRLAAKYPENFRIFPTEALNDRREVFHILRFCGFKQPVIPSNLPFENNLVHEQRPKTVYLRVKKSSSMHKRNTSKQKARRRVRKQVIRRSRFL